MKYFCYNHSIYHLKSDKQQPLFWDDYVHMLGNVLKSEKGVLKLIPYFVRNSIVFYWAPDFLRTCLNFLFRNKIIYLCWGFPQSNSKGYILKIIRLYFILKLSDVVFVNDEVTKKRLISLWNIKSVLIPYFVDCEFFYYKKKDINHRLLIVGNKDRDEDFVKEISTLDFNVIRVTSDERIKSFFESDKTSNLNVVFKPDYVELRRLYHNCDVFVMPINSVDHAAGQTAIMEAIASGCPVVMTDCPSASIFSDFPTVFTSKNDLNLFEININLAQQLIKDCSPLLLESSKKISNSMSLENLAKMILSN